MMAAVLTAQLWAVEDVHMPASFSKLAAKAKESVDVSLDASMLQLASAFLSSDDPDEAKVKKLVQKLKGVYVRSFEFEREGQYSPSDVESVREWVRGPGWTRIVGVKSLKGGDNSEVYVKKDGNQVGGVVVIDEEPKELTVVNIEGPIDPQELSELGGHMGIPKLGKWKKAEKGTSKGDQ